jgi:hypothetical protein
MVVGCKIFMRPEGILRDEGEKVQLVDLAMVVGSKWKRSRFKWDLDFAGDILNRSSRWREQHGGWWKVGITVNLKTRWKIIEYALKSQNTSFADFVKKLVFKYI